MKTFIGLICLTLVQLLPQFSQAYILPLDNILQKSAGLAGNSIISIDQDVQFKDGNKTYTIKENWLIEGDRNLRLTAKGTGELKEAINLSYVYNNKNRTSMISSSKSTKPVLNDFFERFLAIKSKDSYFRYLKELGISEEVRLSRAVGSVCFAIGKTSSEGELYPEMWIDQNSFRLMKIRLPGNAEVEFSNYIEKDGVHYPKSKTINWDGKTVTINVTKINTKSKAAIKDFYPDSVDNSNPVLLSERGLAGSVFDDFYQRFR